jgi:hypothetical protein
MLKQNHIFYLLLVIMVIVDLSIKAQDQDWGEDGAIQDAEVVIEKDRQITLEKANRGYEKVSPLPTEPDTVAQQYSFDPIHYSATPFTPRIRVNRIKEEPLPKLYGNYVKGGIGNYGTTYLEGFFNHKRSETHTIGGHIKSLNSARGPVDKGNSATSEFDVGFNGSYFTDNLTFHGSADFDRDKLFYYGYTPGLEVDRDSIKQIYSKVDIGLGLEDSSKGEGLDFSLTGHYTSFGDEFDNHEDLGTFNFEGRYQLNDHLGFSLQSDLYISKRTFMNSSQNRNLFRIRPMVHTQVSIFDLEVGVNLVHENDTIENADKLHIAPVATAYLDLTDRIEVYAGISGDVTFRSFMSFVEENPYLRPDASLSHSITTFKFSGGLRGTLAEKLSFHTGFSLGTYKNLSFFTNSISDSTKFDIRYDTDNPTLVHYFGELGYTESEKLQVNFRTDLYGYSTKSLSEPWGRPTYSFKLSGNYNYYEKLVFGASLRALGGIKALNEQSGQQEKLDGIFDLNLSVDYLFSKRFSAFVIGKNIFSKEYELYLNYPSRGFTAIAGISYSF